MRDLCIIQSNCQLRSVYGDHDARNFSTNHAGSIVYTSREQYDANAYSEMLSYRTIRREQRSYSYVANGRSVNINHSKEKRALMLPQELKKLPADDLLLFFEAVSRFAARRTGSSRTAFFKQRILPPVEIPAFGQKPGTLQQR